MEGRLQIFSGNANRPLAQEIAGYLNINLGRAIVSRFKNGESRIKLEENVRGSAVFVIQPTCTPVNEHLMELLLLIDALRRASAARVTAVIPYYGYAKQEKKTTGREPISAKLVANLIVTAGAHRVLTLDLHAPAIEGFFDIPVDHLRATPLLARRWRQVMAGADVVAVSPDAGGVARADDFRARVGAPLAIISKRHPHPDATEVLEMVGDVDGKTCVIIDDMISTAGTLVEAAELLQARGAAGIHAAATHGIFAGDAISLIERSPISKVFITDTVPLPKGIVPAMLETITVAPLLAEAIMRIHKDLSVSALFH